MIRQIEEKVVNRLRQVTSAIRQDGANQVSIITSTAERTAAVEFAKAAAMRPQIVGAALNRISEDPEIEAALFEVLENQKLLEGEARASRWCRAAANCCRSCWRRRRRRSGRRHRLRTGEKCENDRKMLDVIVIGAGPVGLACAIEACRAGLDARVIDKGALVNSIVGYPAQMEFF